MGMEGFSCRKNAEIPGAHKIGAAISGPRIAEKNVYGHECFFLFLILSGSRKRGVEFKGGSLHDGFGCFDGFGGCAKHLALLLLLLENTVPRGSREF